MWFIVFVSGAPGFADLSLPPPPREIYATQELCEADLSKVDIPVDHYATCHRIGDHQIIFNIPWKK